MTLIKMRNGTLISCINFMGSIYVCHVTSTELLHAFNCAINYYNYNSNNIIYSKSTKSAKIISM